MDSTQFCHVCWNNTNLIELPWKDKYWSSWITMWMIEWVTTNKMTTNDEIKCINHEWKSMLSYYKIITQLNTNEADKLNEAYNQVYFAQKSDIVACPWSGWNYIGYMPDKTCSSQMICEKWGYKWRLSSQMSIKDKSILMLRNMLFLHFETFSYLNDVIFGKPCPNWSIIIYKDGGWDKVTWTNWNHKFWWYCRGLHNNTDKSQNEDCIIPRLFSPLAILISLLFVILKLYIQTPNLISEVQLYSDKIIEMISWVTLSFFYFSALSFEIVLIYLCIQRSNEKIPMSEAIRSNLKYLVLSIVYPIAWSYGLYTNFIQV